MTQYIDKAAVVAEIKKLIDEIYAGRPFDSLSSEQQTALEYVKNMMSSIDTLEVKEMNVSNISENLAEADEYLNYTHTSNLAHNKPMIVARLRRAIKELYNAGLFQLTHDKKYRLESLGLQAQKGDV